MKLAQNITIVVFMVACLVAVLGWPAALAWYVVIVLGGWVLFGVVVGLLVLVGAVVS